MRGIDFKIAIIRVCYGVVNTAASLSLLVVYHLLKKSEIFSQNVNVKTILAQLTKTFLS